MKTKMPGHDSGWGARGQAMVEMSFVIFILLLFVYGITEFGRAMYTKNMLNNAARAAARVAVVTPNLQAPGANPTYPAGTFANGQDCTQITTDNVQRVICQSLFYVNRPDIQASVRVDRASGSIALSNDAVTVDITNNNFTSLVPGLFGPTGLMKFFPSTMTGSATMRYE